MKETILKILENYAWLLSVLALLGIEASPIKINPLSWIFKLFGKLLGIINTQIHKEIYSTQKEIIDRLDRMEKDNDFKDVMELKNKLCNYKVLIQTTGLDEFQYTRCFELIEKYKYYHDKYPGEVNGHMDAVINYIERQYEAGNVLESGVDE